MKGEDSSRGQPGGPPSLMPLSSCYSLLIRFISNPRAPTWWGFLVAALMFVCSTMQSLILHQYFHCIFVTGLKLRVGITGLVYRKVSWSRVQVARELWRGSGTQPVALLSPCRLWSSPILSSVSPLWEKSSISSQWMPSASWTLPPSST